MNKKYQRFLKEIAIFVGLMLLGYLLLFGLSALFSGYPFGSNGAPID